MSQQIETPRSALRRGMVNNSTATASLSALAPTATEPVSIDDTATLTTGTAVGFCGGNQMVFHLTGTGADNSVTVAELWFWSKVESSVPGTATTEVWLPIKALSITATLSAYVGVASTLLIATERVADTLVDGASLWPTAALTIISPTGDLAGSIYIDPLGAQKWQWRFNITDATASNVLWRCI